MKPTDLADLIQKVTDLQSPAFPQHMLTTKLSIPEAVAKIDPDLIKQVLINIIKNAAEASGENPCKIEIDIKEKDTNYLVEVHDNGPGIPAEMIDKVFEAYFTTKHTGPTPGMGLGLAVCQKILLDHFGELKVESKPGDTVFTLVIPKEIKNV